MMKKIYLILAQCFVVGALMAQAPTDGLVGYYPLNGNYNDSTTNNYHGVASGIPAPTTDRFNNSNSAYFLDGSAVINITGTQFNLNQATWSFWANVSTMPPTTAPNCFNFIGKMDACIGQSGQCERNGIRLGVCYEGTSFAILAWGQFPVTEKAITDPINKVSINQWHHYVATYTLGGSMAFYKDGVLVGSQSGLPESLTWTTNPLSLGTSNGGYYPNFKGKIDDVRIYNRALTASEITQLYEYERCPAPRPTAPDVSRCGNGSVTLTATGGSTYKWYTVGTGGTAVHTGASYTTPNLSTNTTYYVANSNGTCESSRDTVRAIVNALPSVSLTTITGNGFVNVSAANITLSGSPAGGVYTGPGVSGSVFNPGAAGLGNKTVSYTITSQQNCSNTATRSVIVYDTVACSVTVEDTLKIKALISGTSPEVYELIKVYPNPASTHVNILVSNSALLADYRIKIINLQSQEKYNAPLSTGTQSIALTTLGGTGLYFIQLYNAQNELLEVKKLVLE